MKTLRILLAAMATAALTTSCLNNDDVYNAGFYFYRPFRTVNALYANSVIDSISMFSYGNWSVSTSSASGGNWLTMSVTSGRGSTVYSFPLTFKQNTTGESRYAEVNFIDQTHPYEGHATLYYWQYATRGDGSLGNAPDVTTISGSDGSLFELAYDELHRPTSLRATKDEQLLHSLTISYNDHDSIITVDDRGNRLVGGYGVDYQPRRLVGEHGDTIGYFNQYYPTGYPMEFSQAFNLEHRSSRGTHSAYAFLMGGQDMSPDSLYCADSLRIATTVGGTMLISKMKLRYSNTDNRRQTVDANQLLFGIEQCDPYQLLSLFRYARQGRIVSEATAVSEADAITVATTLHADGSVHTLTVSHRGNDVVYTFHYNDSYDRP